MAILTKAKVTQACPAWEQSAREALDEARRQVQRAIADVRYNAEDATASATRTIRRNPLKAVGLVACAGTMAGALLGFSLGWYAKPRR